MQYVTKLRREQLQLLFEKTAHQTVGTRRMYREITQLRKVDIDPYSLEAEKYIKVRGELFWRLHKLQPQHFNVPSAVAAMTALQHQHEINPHKRIKRDGIETFLCIYISPQTINYTHLTRWFKQAKVKLSKHGSYTLHELSFVVFYAMRCQTLQPTTSPKRELAYAK